MNAGRIAAGKLSQQPVDLGLCALAVFRSRKRHGSLEAAALQVCDDGDLRGGIRHVQLEAQLMLLGQHGRIVLEAQDLVGRVGPAQLERSEEHTSELQSLMRISYAVFCLKKKNKHEIINQKH